MRQRFLSGVFALILSVGSLHAMPIVAQSAPPTNSCAEGTQPGGALWLICVPTDWNGDLFLWAHGYVPFNQPLAFQNLTLVDGTYLPDLVQRSGFAFATSSYRTNGLAILEGAADMRELVTLFNAKYGRPHKTYLVGISAGGLITTLPIEQSPALFSGGMATCGPIGDFKAQVDYWGNFRILFDYFFPDVLPGAPFTIPQKALDDWDHVYVPKIIAALEANPDAARQLIKTSGAAIDPNDPSTIALTTLKLLWYNVFTSNDGIIKLDGNPYSNKDRWYTGSNDDLKLNRDIQRFRADSSALESLKAYKTTGRTKLPLVTLHTTNDELVPFSQSLQYGSKLSESAKKRVFQIPIPRYGHCNFTSEEFLMSFGLLIWRVTGEEPDMRSVGFNWKEYCQRNTACLAYLDAPPVEEDD